MNARNLRSRPLFIPNGHWCLPSPPPRRPAGHKLAPVTELERRARELLGRFPLIDGHNDLPWALRERAGGDVSQVRLLAPDAPGDPDDPAAVNLAASVAGTHTDLPRLAAGGVGAQFWSVYVPASLAGDGAVAAVLEQIDLAHQMIARYPAALELALTAGDVERSFAAGRVASLLGAEAATRSRARWACCACCTRSASGT